MNIHKCRECGSLNVEINRNDKGYYIKCCDCGHYVNVGTAKDAENALKALRRDIAKMKQLQRQLALQVEDAATK